LKIPLSLKHNYVPSWGVYEGVRELLQNAHDAQKEFKAPMSVRMRGNTLVIENNGCTMQYESLLLGHSSKTNRSELIGQYGEGLKLGILALLREGRKVKIRNGSEVWIPEIVMSDKFNCKILQFDIQSNRKNENRIQIEISNIGSDYYENHIRPNFLWLNSTEVNKVTERDYGSILFSPKYKGQIFVKGIFVESRQDLTVGYDLFNVSVDRDRRMVNNWDFACYSQAIWSLAIQHKPELMDDFFNLLEMNSAEVKNIDHHRVQYIPQNIIDFVNRKFEAKFGTRAIPVSNEKEKIEIEHFGRQAVIMNLPLKAILEKARGSIQEVKQSLLNEKIRTYDWNELTLIQQDNLRRAIRLINPIASISLEQISIVDYRSTEFYGMFKTDTGEISLASKILFNPEVCLETLVHEVAHRKGLDGEKGHVEELERIWSNIVRRANI